jgi:hypothetical protein
VLRVPSGSPRMLSESNLWVAISHLIGGQCPERISERILCVCVCVCVCVVCVCVLACVCVYLRVHVWSDAFGRLPIILC